MVKFKSCVAAAWMAMLMTQGGLPAQAQRHQEEQFVLRDNIRRGTIQNLHQIELAVVPAMTRRGAQYIGAEFISQQVRYRLKFVRGSAVIWIDVDARSGQIIAQAGN